MPASQDQSCAMNLLLLRKQGVIPFKHSFNTKHRVFTRKLSSKTKSTTKASPITNSKRKSTTKVSPTSKSYNYNKNHRMNTTSPIFKVSLPPLHGNCFATNKEHLDKILKEGQYHKFVWSKVASELATSLNQLLPSSKPYRVCHVNAKEAKEHYLKYLNKEQKDKRRKITNPNPKLPYPIDVDALMQKKRADAFILHDDHIVLVCTLSVNLCQKIYQLGCKIHNVNPQPNKQVEEGLKLIGNADQMQKDEVAVYTANFGCTDTNMTPPTANCTSSQSKAIDNAICCHRGGSIRSQSNQFKSTPQCLVTPKYTEFYLPWFSSPSLKPSDNWYGKRLNGKGRRTPRFSETNILKNLDQHKLPFPLVASVPKVVDSDKLAACQFENTIRTMAEWLLLSCFPTLPYALTPLIASQNMDRACQHSIHYRQQSLPCAAASRIFPKGACGIMLTKDLHDDGNGAICPGIWTSVLGADNVVLRFMSTQFNIHFKCATHRFAWFQGWIPHKTECVDNPNHMSEGKMDKVERIHHSAFWKPKMEHVALVEFHDECFVQAVDSYSEEKKPFSDEISAKVAADW